MKNNKAGRGSASGGGSGAVCYLVQGVREGLSHKMLLEQRPKGSEGVSSVDFWGSGGFRPGGSIRGQQGWCGGIRMGEGRGIENKV